MRLKIYDYRKRDFVEEIDSRRRGIWLLTLTETILKYGG